MSLISATGQNAFTKHTDFPSDEVKLDSLQVEGSHANSRCSQTPSQVGVEEQQLTKIRCSETHTNKNITTVDNLHYICVSTIYCKSYRVIVWILLYLTFQPNSVFPCPPVRVRINELEALLKGLVLFILNVYS